MLCAAVRCEVLIQHSVRQSNDVIRKSSLIKSLIKEVQQECSAKMLKIKVFKSNISRCKNLK